MRTPTLVALFAALAVAPGCGDDAGASSDVESGADAGADVASADTFDGCASNVDCLDAPAGPVCDVGPGTCGPPPPGGLIGWGDGSTASVELVEVYRPSPAVESTDLAFHPERDQLWVLHRRYEVDGLCTQFGGLERCDALGGYTSIIDQPGTDEQRVEVREDENSWHFMRRPTSMAMGAHDTFATCAEARTGNFEDDPNPFMGPTLWSSNLDVYAMPVAPHLNGSHLDMVHETPWCMGIAHERDNIYWVFNGDVGAIDRYDFGPDHGPGHDYHGDATVHRYVPDAVVRVVDTPSHMAFDPSSSLLYVADSGNQRIVALDTTTGEVGDQVGMPQEPILEYRFVDGAQLTEVVPAGDVLVEPSGLALHDGVLYVADHATSELHAFDLDGTHLRSLDTGLPEGTLSGIEVGPDGRLWFVEMGEGAVYRVDPA